MSQIVLRNDRVVGDFYRPYVVAELNTSHFGDVSTARTMIDSAKAAGCDCVKFQSWTADTLYSEAYYRQNKIAKRMVEKFSFSDQQLLTLADYAKAIGIDFASTPYSIAEAEFLVGKCDVPFIKVASMELNNIPFLRELARLGAPMVLSTGMGTLTEIVEAVNAIEQEGNTQLVILHCTSIYPSPPSLVRLMNIHGLRTEFPRYPIGYSDHTIGIDIPTAAIALGACVLEKHFTLDTKRIGMDNQMATEPDQMQDMIRACHRVHEAIGGAGRILASEEVEQASKMRRSIVARKRISRGENLSVSNIEFKRPGFGIPPTQAMQLMNKRTLRDIDIGELIRHEDLE